MHGEYAEEVDNNKRALLYLVVLSNILPIMPNFVDKFIASAQAGTLSKRDRKFLTDLSTAVKMSPEEEAADMVSNVNPANLKDLSDAISNAKSPEQKKALQDHQTRLFDFVKSAVTSNLPATPPTADGPQYQPDAMPIIDQISNFISNLWSSK